MTTCVVGGRRVIRSTMRRRPFSWAMRYWRGRLKSWQPSAAPLTWQQRVARSSARRPGQLPWSAVRRLTWRWSAIRRTAEAVGIAELEAIHRRKTGALIVASLELGGVVAGASREQLSALAGYGEKVGLAFQITDDLLDVAGEQQAVGKRLGKDADRGKLTFPRLLGVEASRQQAAHLIAEACAMIEIFGANADAAERPGQICVYAEELSSQILRQLEAD